MGCAEFVRILLVHVYESQEIVGCKQFVNSQAVFAGRLMFAAI
jgi:hypothetical protein